MSFLLASKLMFEVKQTRVGCKVALFWTPVRVLKRDEHRTLSDRSVDRNNYASLVDAMGKDRPAEVCMMRVWFGWSNLFIEYSRPV